MRGSDEQMIDQDMASMSMEELVGANKEDLDELFAACVAPDLNELKGVAEGRVLHMPNLDVQSRFAVFRDPTLLWRGKVFEQVRPGIVRGLNRVGAWPRELRLFVFEAYPSNSLFDGDPVIVLDHDFPGNPQRFRRMHDEVRRVRDGLFIASTHIRRRDGMQFLCYFAFEFAPTSIH